MAARTAVERIAERYPKFEGAVVALSKEGRFGAACFGLGNGKFPYYVGDPENGAKLYNVDCIDHQA